MNRSNAVFNFREGDERAWTDPKALAINSLYMNEMPLDRLAAMAKPFLEKDGLWRDEYDGEKAEWFTKVAGLLRDRFHTLQDFTGRGRPYFSDDFPMDEKALNKNLLKKKDELKILLPEFMEKLKALESFDAASIEDCSHSFWEEKGVKPGLVMNACRAAITGATAGPSMFEVFEVIGREKSFERIRRALEGL